MQIQGAIQVFQTHRLSGRRKLVHSKPNLNVYQSGDAAALSLDPQKQYAIRYVYFEFKNGAAVVPTPAVEDDVSLYAGLSAPDDYLRVPIIAAPAYDVPAGEESYFSGNQITFFASTKAAPTDGGGNIVGETNGEVLTDGTSEIHTIGLVASTGEKDDDLLFARTNISPGVVTKQAGYDVDIHWSVRFGPTAP